MKTDTIIAAMASTMYQTAWHDRQDERYRKHREKGTSYPGMGMIHVPSRKTPPWIVREACRLAGKYEQANGVACMEVLIWRAWRADNPDTNHEKMEASWICKQYRERFGVCLAYMAMGHGVSWFDDHAKFALVRVHIEFHLE